MALTFDFTALFQNGAHTGRICGILKKCCGIKGQVRIDFSS